MNIRHAITRRALLALALVVMLGSLGTSCKDKFYGEARLIEYPCPLLPITPARRTIIPHSQSFSLAMFNFIDQTGKAGQIAESLPDALCTLFFQSGRFAVYDRGQLRHDDYQQLMAQWQKHQKHEPSSIAKEWKDKQGGFLLEFSNREVGLGPLMAEFYAIMRSVDTILVGAVTEIDHSELSVDYRLINANSRVVLYAGAQRLRFTRTGKQIDFQREGLKRIVRMVMNALPDPKALRIGEIMIQDGRILTVNLGRKEKIVPGLSALILAPDEQILKTSKGEDVRNVMYLAEAYVVAVYENSCKLRIFNPPESDDPKTTHDCRVGDFVKFK